MNAAPLPVGVGVVGVGVVGTGFMGLSHTIAFTNAPRILDIPVRLHLAHLVDASAARAGEAARQWGFARSGSDWRALVDDPAVSLVAIAAPNHLHRPIALAAAAAGKHVYCEKPLAPSGTAAREMAAAAKAGGVRTRVGFQYLANPVVQFARDLIRQGEIGEVRFFRGLHAEDYMADASTPCSWRTDPDEGGGAMADLGSHVLAMARFLAGPIAGVLGDIHTAIPERPTGTEEKEPRSVGVEDVGRAVLRFESGATGSAEGNWMATGRKMQLEFEVGGSAGAIRFTQERFNELNIYRTVDPAGVRGFRTICAGTEHGRYANFLPAAGHQLGFNDLKIIEAGEFLEEIAGGPPSGPDFAEGAAVQETLDAIYRSARSGGWEDVRPSDGLETATSS